MFSIIMPLDDNRLEQFKNTKRVYDAMPQKKEFIIPTRSKAKLRKYFDKYDLGRDVRIIPYTIEAGFNCSKALNIGARSAKYSSIIITSPEVKPITPVLEQPSGYIAPRSLSRSSLSGGGHHVVSQPRPLRYDRQ